MHAKALLAIAALAVAGAASAQQALPAAEAGAGLSRAEVVADLNLCKRAGMGQYAVSNASFLPGHEERLVAYQRLRSGPEYLAEAQRVQAGGASGCTVTPVPRKPPIRARIERHPAPSGRPALCAADRLAVCRAGEARALCPRCRAPLGTLLNQ